MNKKKYSPAEILLTIVGYIVLLVAIICALFPAFWMAISSVKPQSELFSIPPTFMVQNPTYDSSASAGIRCFPPRCCSGR